MVEIFYIKVQVISTKSEKSSRNIEKIVDNRK